MNNYPRQSLFPSASNIASAKHDLVSGEKEKEFDWLENSSFTADTAKKYVEFQAEVKSLQAEAERDPSKKHDDQTTAEDRTRTVEKLSKDADTQMQPVKDIHSNHKYKQKEKRRYADSPESKPSKSRHRERNHDSASPDRHNKYKHKKKKKISYRSDSSGSDTRQRKKREKSYDSSSSESHHHHHKKKKSKSKKKKKHKEGKSYDDKTKTQDVKKYEKVDDKRIFVEEFNKDSTVPTYKIDKNKDPNSYIYGSLYKLHIPNYKDYYRGCVGSDQRFTENTDGNKKKSGFSNRYFGKENRGLIKQVAVESLTYDVQQGKQADCETDKPVHLESYIDIGCTEPERQPENVDVRQKILDTATSLYVKGVGEVKMEEEDAPRNPVLIKVEQFNRQLRQTPGNVKLWLEFVKFQDIMSADDVQTGRSLEAGLDLKCSTRSVIEKKISILDKALESNPSNIELLLARLELYREIWDSTKVSKELEQLLFIHPANIELWKHYIAFNQSQSSGFSVSKVTKLYHKCLKTLMSVMDGKMHTHTVPENLEEEVTGIFLQYCYFLRQTGHREKCIATLQAIVEYSLFCPPELESADRDTRVAALETFWDKLGTKRSGGWRGLNQQGAQENVTDSDGEDTLEDLEQAVIDAEHDKYVSWLEIEALRESHHWFPWQPDQGQTEEDCEDVERLVLFDDVSPVLFKIPTHLWCDFSLCVLDLLQIKQAHHLQLKPTNMVEFSNEISNKVLSDNHCCLTRKEVDKSLLDFAVNLLTAVGAELQGYQKLVLVLASIEIQLQYYGQKEASLSKHDKREMRKIVKGVLKEEEYRNNLFVWVRYIDLERVVGKAGEAVCVAETALTMYSGTSIQETADTDTGLILLAATYCDILLDKPNTWPCTLWEKLSPVSVKTKQIIMYVLHCLIEGKKFKVTDSVELTTVTILKTSSKFSKCIDNVLEELRACDVNQDSLLQTKLHNLCRCYSVFVYCAKDLPTAVNAFKSALSMIQNSENRNKWADLGQKLCYSQLGLILYHMSRSSVTLSFLRECLNKALEVYPEQTEFIWLYIEVERKCRVSGRMNRFIDSRIHYKASPVTVVLAVCAELQRLRDLTSQDCTGSGYDEVGVSTSALVNRTRSWLERCLNQSALQSCPLLWRLYLQLESDVGNTTRLKGIFYRAIQQCPWVKSLHTDGVSYLKSSQLQEIVDLMVEKELRVQIPVEELDILISP